MACFCRGGPTCCNNTNFNYTYQPVSEYMEESFFKDILEEFKIEERLERYVGREEKERDSSD